MDLNNNCCHTDTLSEIKVLFHYNLDHLVLMCNAPIAKHIGSTVTMNPIG